MSIHEIVRCDIKHSLSDLASLANSEMGQPKLYSSIPSTEIIEPRKQNRDVGKDELIVVKECVECRKKIRKAKKEFMCKCKKYLYCSFDCKQASRHECRVGEPTKFSMVKFASRIKEIGDEQGEKEKNKALMKKYKSEEEMEKMAESEDPWAAFLIGVSYSERIARKSKKSPFPIMPVKYLDKSIAETDEIAIKWLQIAAEGGIKDAMIALAHKISAGNLQIFTHIEGNGLKTDSRLGFYWLCKAMQSGATLGTESMELMERSLLIGEIDTFIESAILQAQSMEYFGHTLKLFGPNLGSLLMAARNKEIEKWDGKTFNGGIFYPFHTVTKLMGVYRACNLVPEFVAGRAGSVTSVARLCVTAERTITNPQFRQGVKGTTENGGLLDVEQINRVKTDFFLYQKDAWFTTERSKYDVTCMHLDSNVHITAGGCYKCCDGALNRATAVAEGFYSISIYETVPGYGYGARFFTETDGNIILETFKRYSKPEICCVLECLMSNPADLHPLHLAEDPNLYWPIIWFYGSIYTALLECCGSKIVKKFYGKLGQYRSKKNPSSSPVSPTALSAFPSSAVGEMRIACGSEVCPRLDHSDKFLKCTGCRVRYYCTEQCQRADWKKHKSECKWEKKPNHR